MLALPVFVMGLVMPMFAYRLGASVLNLPRS